MPPDSNIDTDTATDTDDTIDSDAWAANKHRPAWVRRHAAALTDAAGLEDLDPIPNHLAAVRDWLDTYKGTVTRRLNSTTTESDAANAANPTDAADDNGGEA